jgi:hypothetical protein
VGLIRKNFKQVDAETGEVQEGLAVYKVVTRGLKDRHIMMTNPGLDMLAFDVDLKWEDLRVFLAYAGATDFENKIRRTQKEVSELTGICKVNVSRSTKKLVEKNYLIEEEKVGRSKVYRLNVVFGWKGKVTRQYDDLLDNDCRLLPSTWNQIPVLKT